MSGFGRLALAVAALVVAVATVAGCSSSPRSQDAFCAQGPALARAKRAVDGATAGDLSETKRRMAAYNRAIQKAVEVAPESIADDVEPLGKMWADIDRDVQRARSTEELTAATQAVLTDRQTAYKRASATVNAYVDAHCTSTGGTK